MALDQFNAQFPGHFGRNFILNCEDIDQVPVVGFRPRMIAIRRVDKLSSNANSLTVLANASLNNVVDA